MEETELRPARAKLNCKTCGLTVERVLYGNDAPISPWLCPDCDPDQSEDEEPHYSDWMQPAELYGFGFDSQRGREWVPAGYQECAPRRAEKKIPDWVDDRAVLKQVIFSHPQSKRLADKWAAVVYRYYNLQQPAAWIAEEMGLKLDAVKNVIKKLRKRAATFSLKSNEEIGEFSRASKLFKVGRSVRKVAKELNCSIGKADKLRNLSKAA